MSILTRIIAKILGSREDRALQQARADQRKADHPGCVRGYIACRSLTCDCHEGIPSERFVRARAAQIRAGRP